MSTIISTPEELASLRRSGEILVGVFRELEPHIRVGMTGAELDRLAESYIRSQGAEPSFLGYQGYPSTLCVSVNDQTVHTIPDTMQFAEGDIVSVDVGVRYQGICTDAAITYPLGEISSDLEHLLKVDQQALAAGIDVIRPGAKVQDISRAIQTVVESAGLTIIRELSGHGVGHQVHEFPTILNYVAGSEEWEDDHAEVILEEGMVLALEPIITTGKGKIRTESDGWSIRTRDSAPTSIFEKTILVTADGYEVITAW